MARSPLSALAAFSVPVHLNIFGWGMAAAVGYALAPEAFASPVVGIGMVLFGFLFGVVAVTLLIIRVGAEEQARQVKQMSWGAISLALLGAVLLQAVAIRTTGTLALGAAVAALAVGVLVGLLSVRSLRRDT
ncbi:hypothetical protein [Rubricoccus marinus]|uniref:Uncharacterized protein n=1 Tax=Rubricoccus marinus TaxID=716817 RepID=A0A259TZ56_9BACT|nr:hypothetical protein [Rubricoccus marinus]OZC02966.1 hypothetical protein BSZ36_08275 [Rubricoccus marinus]